MSGSYDAGSYLLLLNKRGSITKPLAIKAR